MSQSVYKLDLSDLSLYNTHLLEEMVKSEGCHNETSVFDETIAVYAEEQGIPKSANCIELILPKTQAPSNFPHNDCKPGLVHFSYWFRQFFIYFDKLESFTLTNMWPLSFDQLFHAFNIYAPNTLTDYNAFPPFASNLKHMDLGFFGYHAWSENAFQFFASGIFSHVDRIDMEDRCGVQQFWENGNHMEWHKYLEFMSNIYWEGCCATDWVDLYKNRRNYAYK